MARDEAVAARESGKEEMLPVARKGMTRRCKFCIGCAVITVVVLAVAIPVGVLVVGPAIAQQAIDMSTLHIHHSTIYHVDQATGLNGTQYNAMTIHSPSIFPAKLQNMTVTLVADQPGYDENTSVTGKLFSNGPFANFTMTEVQVHKGDTVHNWTTPILFNKSDAADGGFRFMGWTLLVNGALDGGQVVRINLTAEPKVKSFGLTFQTKMVKPIVCNCMKGTGCVPEKPKFNATVPDSTAFDGTLGTDYVPTIFLFCEPEGTDVSNGTAWNNSMYFQNETGHMMKAAVQLSEFMNRFLS